MKPLNPRGYNKNTLSNHFDLTFELKFRRCKYQALRAWLLRSFFPVTKMPCQITISTFRADNLHEHYGNRPFRPSICRQKCSRRWQTMLRSTWNINFHPKLRQIGLVRSPQSITRLPRLGAHQASQLKETNVTHHKTRNMLGFAIKGQRG